MINLLGDQEIIIIVINLLKIIIGGIMKITKIYGDEKMKWPQITIRRDHVQNDIMYLIQENGE
jgi:hypothetical protein